MNSVIVVFVCIPFTYGSKPVVYNNRKINEVRTNVSYLRDLPSGEIKMVFKLLSNPMVRMTIVGSVIRNPMKR